MICHINDALRIVRKEERYILERRHTDAAGDPSWRPVVEEHKSGRLVLDPLALSNLLAHACRTTDDAPPVPAAWDASQLRRVAQALEIVDDVATALRRDAQQRALWRKLTDAYSIIDALAPEAVAILEAAP